MSKIINVTYLQNGDQVRRLFNAGGLAQINDHNFTIDISSDDTVQLTHHTSE